MAPPDSRVASVVAQLRSRPSAKVEAEAIALLQTLRDAREFACLGELAEALSRINPKDAAIRVPYAQSLIETGRASAAIDVLRSALRMPNVDSAIVDELSGLIGRANKQIYIDAVDRSTDAARAAINDALEGYRVPFERDRSNVWHALNLAAVLHAARRGGTSLDQAKALDGEAIARGVLAGLEQVPPDERTQWWSAAKGEAYVALGEWEPAEAAVHDYVTDPNVPAFHIASTLRQLREVWEIHRDSNEGAGLLQLLEARLAGMPGATLELRAQHVRTMRAMDEPTASQRERVLGDADAQPIRWYRTALDRAASVAAVRMKSGARFGTAFAVAAADFGLASDEVLVLTNFHVVNRNGADKAEKPGSVEIVFEAAGRSGLGPYSVAEVLAESPFNGGLDYALLRLSPGARLPTALDTTLELPHLDDRSRVSVIGHPNQSELHLALQENELLDHEGPPDGKPPVASRVRVHYFTPTSKGNSGSPVFDVTWRVIALHHAGGKYDPIRSEFGLGQLNGKSELYSANEGLWIGSIREDAVRQLRARSAAPG